MKVNFIHNSLFIRVIIDVIEITYNTI